MLWLFRLSDIIFLALVAVNTFLNIEQIGTFFTSGELEYIENPAATEENPLRVELIVANSTDTTNFFNTNASIECGDSGNKPTITVHCNHRTTTFYIIYMCLTGLYYLVLYIVRFLASHKYPIDDFRHNFFLDQFNQSLTSRILFAVGMLISISMFIVGHVYETIGNELPTPGDVWPLYMFVIISFVGLNFSSDYAEHNETAMWEEEEMLQKPITIKDLPGGMTWGNVAGLAFDRKEFFSQMQLALSQEYTSGGVFAKLTDNPAGLLFMMKKLSTDAPESVTPANKDTGEDNKGPSVEVVESS